MTMFNTISTHALADLFKTRLGHDRFWVRANNPTILPADPWGIVSDYWSDDPRIVDIVIQEQAEKFTTTGAYSIDGQLPDAFIIHLDDWRGGGLVNLRINVMANGDWRWGKDDVSMLTTLLMLPDMEDDPRSSWISQRDGDNKVYTEYAHLPLIRDYLYYRLEHPEIPVNRPDYSDPLFTRFY